MWSQAGISTILPVMGIAIGALLQYYFGRSLELRKQMAMLKSQAYVDYFRAFAIIAKQGATNESLAAVTDAKVRICVYGSGEVVRKLSAFEEAGAVAKTSAGSKAILDLLSVMRAETSPRDGVNVSELKNIILGPDQR